MNQKHDDTRLTSLRNGYRDVRYPGRLAEDIEASCLEPGGSSTSTLPPKRPTRARALGRRTSWMLGVSAVAATVLLIASANHMLRTPPNTTPEPAVAENRSANQAKPTETIVQTDPRDPTETSTHHSPEASRIENATPDARSVAATRSKVLRPTIDDFRVFLRIHNRAVSKQRELDALAVAFQSRVRVVNGDQPGERFSVFPNSPANSTQTPATKTRRTNTRKRTFNVFPSRSRESRG